MDDALVAPEHVLAVLAVGTQNISAASLRDGDHDGDGQHGAERVLASDATAVGNSAIRSGRRATMRTGTAEPLLPARQKASRARFGSANRSPPMAAVKAVLDQTRFALGSISGRVQMKSG